MLIWHNSGDLFHELCEGKGGKYYVTTIVPKTGASAPSAKSRLDRMMAAPKLKLVGTKESRLNQILNTAVPLMSAAALPVHVRMYSTLSLIW